MTTRDYRILAEGLRAAQAGCKNEEERQGWRRSVVAVVDVLDKDNPRFNESQFLKACGV